MSAHSPIRIAVLGRGRLGQQVADLVSGAPDCELVGTWSTANSEQLEALLDAADIAIDFTLPGATTRIINGIRKLEKPLVCGVTGLADSDIDLMATTAERIPIIYDRNMSIGIAVMTELVRQASAVLLHKFDLHICETHHVHKKDAPSGTAIALRAAAGNPPVEIESRREGEVMGDHAVRFVAENESLELSHRVTDRRVFAEGAVDAARWLVKQRPGLYRISDILTQ